MSYRIRLRIARLLLLGNPGERRIRIAFAKVAPGTTMASQVTTWFGGLK